ncbi:MAG: hypothetical protein Q9183_007916 [Haloplaca sp. 2 TL-2023]
MTGTKDDSDSGDIPLGDATTRSRLVLEEGSVDPVYQAKARALNDAIQQIGMGKYQWELKSDG